MSAIGNCNQFRQCAHLTYSQLPFNIIADRGPSGSTEIAGQFGSVQVLHQRVRGGRWGVLANLLMLLGVGSGSALVVVDRQFKYYISKI